MRNNLLSVAAAVTVLVTIAGCSKPAEDAAPAAAAPAYAQEDADFGLRLALLEGHLMVGNELIKDGQTTNALPHFGHPVAELYGDMRPVIQARGGEQFQADLVGLERLAASEPDSATSDAAFDAVMAKVVAARALIPAQTIAMDDYTVHVVADIATTASQEYRNALVGGKISSLVEYHDARGFIFYAGQLLGEHAASADPRIAQEAAIIAKLRTYVEPLNPPDPPLATDAQFETDAAALRDIAGAK